LLERYAAGTPRTQRNALRGTVAQVTAMPPVVRRQVAQWQCAMSASGAPIE